MREVGYFSLRGKITLMIAGLLIVSIAIIGGSVYYQSRQMVVQSLGTEALTVAEKAITLIDPVQYKDLVENGDENSPYYTELRDKLNDLRDKAGLIYLYTMRKVDGKYKYMVDGEPWDSDTTCAFGQVEDPKNISAQMGAALGGKKVRGDLMNTKEWGRLLSAYMPIKGPDGEILGFLGADMPADEVFKLMVRTLTGILITLCVVLLVSVFVGYALARNISKPLEELAKASDLIAEGDLSVELQQVQRGDEIGRLYAAYGRMVDHLRGLVKTLQGRYVSLVHGVEILNETAGSTEHSVDVINSSMQTVAEGSEEQVENLTTAIENILRLLNHIDEIEKNSQQVHTLSSAAEGRAVEGRQVLDIAKNQIAEIDRKAGDSASSIRSLSGQIEQIKGFIAVIASIAKQTNLLALNAAIESARAGEEGRGFAVVAKEIRTLAEEATSAAEEVAKTVGDIYLKSNEAVSAIEMMVTEVQSGVKAINDADRQFENVLDTNHSVNQNIALVADKLKSITGVFHQVKEGMNSVTAVAQEASATTEEVAGLISHERDNIQKIKDESDELIQVAEDLQKAIDRFKL